MDLPPNHQGVVRPAVELRIPPHAGDLEDSKLFPVQPDNLAKKDEARAEPHLFRSQEKHFVVAAGGTEDHPEELLKELGSPHKVLAADGGFRLLKRMGLECDLLVGDFDTLSPGELLEAEERGVAIERHPADKAQSDLELALGHAVRQGASQLTLIGALGGEWDHCLANLIAPLTFLTSHGVWARLLTSQAQVYLADRPVVLRAPGQRVSLHSLSPKVEGLSLSGFEYLLDQAVLHRHQTLGLANRTLSEEARISFQTGELFITLMSPTAKSGSS